MYITTFTVRPTQKWAVFPLDMLRYDSCFPADSNAVATIALSYERTRTIWNNGTSVALHQRHATIRHGLTPARWESFGWRVTVGLTRKW